MTAPPPRADGRLLLEAFRRYLRDHSLPVTQQREAVAAAVFFADRHVSVSDLERALGDRGEHVGKATVYRTLELLVRAGLIQEHDFGEGFKRYEPLAARGYHEHLICVRCGRVEEFYGEPLQKLRRQIESHFGFQIVVARTEVGGYCSHCQALRAREVADAAQEPVQPNSRRPRRGDG